jgi:hypothetical protein
MIDPTGKLVLLIRAIPAVATITTNVHGGDAIENDTRPMVLVKRMNVNRMSPTGPGTSRNRQARWRYVLECVGPVFDPTIPATRYGDRQAVALAGAVSSGLHHAGPVSFPISGGRIGLYKILEESQGAVLTDPDTQDPYVPVIVALIGAAQAIPA